MNHSDPPLRGDQNGNLRLLIVGNSGTGKSTMANELAQILSIPVMHLDQVYWKPNWGKTPDDQFREEVASFIRQNDDWVIDGNYKRIVGELTSTNATDIIWMDPPFALYFPRLIVRTLLRLLRLRAPCSPGCDEKLSDIFRLGEESILWWSWTHHLHARAFYNGVMQEAGGDKWIRLGGWGREVRTWLDRVKNVAKLR